MNYSFITYLANDAFIEGVLVLNISLTTYNKKIGLLCLVTNEVSKKCLELLKNNGIGVKEVEWINPVRNDFKGRYGKDEGRYMFTKLNIFKLPFDKILYLDADIIVNQNIENLFDLDTPAAVFDDQALDMRNIGYNGGVLLISPSNEVFKKLIKRIEDYGLWTDQTLLNKSLKFNRLDSVYNTLYKPLKNWDLLFFYFSPPAVIHFNGNKPWIVDGKNSWVKKNIDGCFYYYKKYRRKLVLK